MMLVLGIVIGAAAAALLFLLLGRKEKSFRDPDQPWLGRKTDVRAPVLRKTVSLQKPGEVTRRRWDT